MKKSLIALAVAGVFVAPVAMADTTVYGQANVSIDMVDNGDVTNNHLASNQSRLGLKGSEDLGGGLTAGWQIESGFRVDNNNGADGSNSTGADSLATRNTFVTLGSDSIGTFLLGKHDTPYKLSTRGLDLFADTIADNRNMMGGVDAAFDDGYGRLGNVAAYISPNMGGATIIGATVFGAESAASGEKKGSAYSLAVLYGAGPLAVDVAYQTATFGDAGTGDLAGVANKDAKAVKVGGSYTMDALQLNLVYEKFTSNLLGDQNNWYLGGKYNLGGDAVKLAYTSAGKTTNVSSEVSNEGTQLTVGYDHAMSKRTTVYALYSKITNKDHGNYGFSTVATSGEGSLAAAGKDPSVISVGMKHSF